MKSVVTKGIMICVAALLLNGCGGNKVEETIGGTVSGLLPNPPSATTPTYAVTLLDNGGDQLQVSANGQFQFATPVEAGNAYIVTVGTQPAGETCTVSDAVGLVEQSIGNVRSVIVNCVPSTVVLQGTVTGLHAGNSVTLNDNGTDSLTVSNNGAFAFQNPLAVGQSFNVTVSAQPSGQTCAVSPASGAIAAPASAAGNANTTIPVPELTVTCN